MPKRKRVEDNKGDQIITKFFQRSIQTGPIRSSASNPVATQPQKKSATQRAPSTQRVMSSSQASSNKDSSSSARSPPSQPSASGSASASKRSSASSKPSPSTSKDSQKQMSLTGSSGKTSGNVPDKTVTSPILEAFKRQELQQRQKLAANKGDGKEGVSDKDRQEGRNVVSTDKKSQVQASGLVSEDTSDESAKKGLQGSSEKALPKRRLEYEDGTKIEDASKKKQKSEVSLKISDSKREELKTSLSSSPKFKIKPGMLQGLKKAKETSSADKVKHNIKPGNSSTGNTKEPGRDPFQRHSDSGRSGQSEMIKSAEDQSEDAASGPMKEDSSSKVQKLPAGSLKISEAVKKVFQEKVKASPIKVSTNTPEDNAGESTFEMNQEHPGQVDDVPKASTSKGEEDVNRGGLGKISGEDKQQAETEKARGVMSLFQELNLSVKDKQEQEDEISEDSQSSSITTVSRSSQLAGEKSTTSIKMNIAKLKQIIKVPSLSPQTSAATSPAPSDKGGESGEGGVETKSSPGSGSGKKGEGIEDGVIRQQTDIIKAAAAKLQLNLPSTSTVVEKQEANSDQDAKQSILDKDPENDSGPEDMDESKAFDSDDELEPDSDDSDDDLLCMPVANLADLQSASMRPLPSTPQKMSESQEIQYSPMSPATEVPMPGKVNFKFSLDYLLAEQNKTVGRGEPRRLRDVTDELMKDVLQGGFARMVADLEREEHEGSDSDKEGKLENPKHKKFVRDRNLKKMEIPDMHPGETLFNSKDMGRLFDFPGSLTLAACGLVPPLDQQDPLHLLFTSPDCLEDLVTSGVLEDMYAYSSCPEPLQRWLFLVMSISRDQHVVNSAYKTLTSIFMSNWSSEEDDNSVWLPSLADVTRVLLNYGAQLQDLYPLDSSKPCFREEDLSLPLCDEEKENQNGNVPSDIRGSQDGQRGLPAVNFTCVLQTLEKLNVPPRNCTLHIYSEQDMVHMVCLLCRTLLDVQLRGLAVQSDFQNCISEMLDWFEEERWPRMVETLCSSLPHLSSHHHNLLTLARHMPCSERGRHLQRKLSLCMIRKILKLDKDMDDSTDTGTRADGMDDGFQLTELTPVLPDCQMKNILALVSSERESQYSSQESDDGGRSFENDREAYYLLSTLVHLIDMAVGNEPLCSSERDALVQVIQHLNSISASIRDNIKLFHRSKVKNLVTRTVAKLDFLKDGMKQSQRTLFSYFKDHESRDGQGRHEESGSSPIWKSGQLSETNHEDSESGTHRSGRLSAMSVESNQTGITSTRQPSPDEEAQNSHTEMAVEEVEPEEQILTN